MSGVASNTQPSSSSLPGPSSSSRKRPRQNDQASSSRKRQRGIMPPEAPKKFKADPYHLKREDIPEDATGIKTALEIHIRILLGAVSNISVPEQPDLHAINTFEQRFTSAAEVDRLLKGHSEAASRFQQTDRLAMQSYKDVRARCATDPGSTIVLAISRVPENAIRMMFGTVHSFHLSSWRPDLITGTPTSIYNGALEAIAIWTFEQAAATFAYQHLSPNLRFLQDTMTMQKLYRNFVWSYMRGLVLKEKKTPGSVARSVQENKVYKHRAELTEKREKYLQDNGWNDRIQLLAGDVECTSDHEPNPEGPGFWIMRKRARNSHVTDFLRAIDARRTSSTPLFRGQRRGNMKREEQRIPHPRGQESQISERVPKGCPLDWFDPDFFNNLGVEFRALYVDSPIALPLAEDCGSTGLDNPDWKRMLYPAFLEKYGNRVRSRYNLPTPEELADLERSGADALQSEEDIPQPNNNNALVLRSAGPLPPTTSAS